MEEEGASLFEMPPDRENGLVVIAKKNASIGSRKEKYDLSQLQGFRLCSHGVLSKQEISLIIYTPLVQGERILGFLMWLLIGKWLLVQVDQLWMEMEKVHEAIQQTLFTGFGRENAVISFQQSFIITFKLPQYSTIH
jgi:hypothetical protein